MVPAAYTKAVADIYDAVLDDELAPTALQTVAEYVGATSAAYSIVNTLTGQVSSRVSWGSFTGSTADYLTHYSKIDQFRALEEKAVCGDLALLSECLPQSVLRYDEWYNDFVLRGGVRDILGTKLHESASHKVLFGLHRAIGDERQFPEDIEALHTLLPHLCNAAGLRVGLIDTGYRPAITGGGFDHVGAGVVFANGDGTVVETNSAGERILRSGDGLTIRNGQICARRSFETAKLTCLIAKAAAARGSSGGCMLIARDNGRSSYVVRVAPVSTGAAGYDLPMAMIFISAPDENRISEGELAELYGLSRSESRLAMALASGKRMIELAGEFGVQITTLRTQLSSILRKCEVERQSDLVRLVSSIPVVRPSSSASDWSER
jgi:DNA-binding CsgD family transcriptional regulator